MPTFGGQYDKYFFYIKSIDERILKKNNDVYSNFFRTSDVQFQSKIKSFVAAHNVHIIKNDKNRRKPLKPRQYNVRK